MDERILIVEDEAITALDLKYSLEELGYKVIDTVDTGQDAIDTAAETIPDVVLMDIKLKGDMEGRSLLLFCNKGDTMIDMLVRTVNGIQLVNFIPEAEELQENGRPGAMIIPERKQRFLKDVTAQISHDGEIVKVDRD